MKRILIMGLPGTGKTTFAEELQRQLKKKGKTCAWFNADNVRKLYVDWDFSPEGRIRQSERMRKLAYGMMTDYVICDFVAPTEEVRNIFSPDYIIWMNTEEKSEYEDTNAIFEEPLYSDFMITEKNAVEMAKITIAEILI